MPTPASPTPPRVVTAAEAAAAVDWRDVIEAIEAGHRRPKAEIADTLLARGGDRLLSRAAWIDGLGAGVKTASVFPDAPPTIKGAMLVFDDQTGAVRAVVENDAVTNRKTAGDSALGVRLLARDDAKLLLLVGAGSVAAATARAMPAALPSLTQIRVWNRTTARAEALAAALRAEGVDAAAAPDLAAACAEADVISSATMSVDPILHGEWIRPGTHIDLIGAFTPAMREADDALLLKASLFVDSRATTIEHIGELKRPIAAGVITPDHVRGDFYDLIAGRAGRRSTDEITVFKNGGGAHLDLMVADRILRALGA